MDPDENAKRELAWPISSHLDRTSLVNIIYVCIIDQARGRDSWILAEFSFFVFIDLEEVEVHKNAKRELDQYPAILVNKRFITWHSVTEKNDLRPCIFSSTEKETSYMLK